MKSDCLVRLEGLGVDDSAHQATILSLLAKRECGATICPSEAARELAADRDWRSAMPGIHAAVDSLLRKGAITISWKGHKLDERAGPYRIAAATK